MRKIAEVKRSISGESEENIDKAQRIDGAPTNVDVKNLELILWNKLVDSGNILLSIDAIHPDYEIQMVDLYYELFTKIPALIKLLSSFPAKIFLATNNKNQIVPDTIVSTVELYGRYASRQFNNKYPIFCYEDYLNSKITFYAFLVTNTNQGIHGILLFDNYEAESEDTYSLRFEWWFPLSRLIKDDSVRKQLTDSVVSNLSSISDDFLFKANTYIKPFKNSPIKATFDRSFTESFSKNKGTILGLCRENVEDAQKKIGQIVKDCTSIDNIKKEAPQYNPEMRYKYLNIVPLWYSIIKSEIQVPMLNTPEWKNLEVMHAENGENPLGPDFKCAISRGKIPNAIKNIARLYSDYLKQEENYDFPIYGDSAENEHEIYCILDKDYKFCVGLFIFKTGIKCSNLIEDVKRTYETVSQEIDEVEIKKWSEAKFNNNKRKYDETFAKYKKENPFSVFSLLFPLNRDTPYKKYEDKIIKYESISFFAHAKDKLPKDLEDGKELTVAWIHPSHRRQGFLSKLWPIFSFRYGLFTIDKPSEAMKNFINKHQVQQLHFRGGKKLVT